MDYPVLQMMNDEMLAVLQACPLYPYRNVPWLQGCPGFRDQAGLNSKSSYAQIMFCSVPLPYPRTGSTWGWKRLPSEQPLGLLTCGAGTVQCFLVVSTLRHSVLIGGVSLFLSHYKNKSQITCWQLFFLQKSPSSMALMQLHVMHGTRLQNRVIDIAHNAQNALVSCNYSMEWSNSLVL